MKIESTVVGVVGVGSWMEVFVVEMVHLYRIVARECSTEGVEAMSVHLEYSSTQMKNPSWTWMMVVVVVGAVFQQGVGEVWEPKVVSEILLVQLMPPSR
jgi:hypothetical protein